MDQTNPEYRSKMMSKIRSTGGRAETMLSKALWHSGVRYRRNYKKLPGKPDIAITKYKIAVFIDGEFWHGYDWENQKKKRIHTHREYWIPKIEGNMVRDRKQEKELNAMGWTVIRFWERHEVLKDLDACVEKVIQNIK
ncbi:very short patch repair endonuclease [Oenococcus oeni]|nr:very short patch repair endonuclease [Oenococcus oeni]KGH52521.1 endonuclease [Oenococcus oeni S11]MDS0176480.1 very short patch repair endonuclease [Oenococcus oeni]